MGGKEGSQCVKACALLVLSVLSFLQMAEGRLLAPEMAPAPAPGPGPSGSLEGGNDMHGMEPCTDAGLAVLANSGIVPYETVVACLATFPFDLAAALATVDSLKKMLTFYVFEDIARSSPSPLLPSHVLLSEGLDRIAVSASQGWYWNEYEFDSAITKLFASLNDAHTLYTPKCFGGSWVFTHGLTLIAPVEDGILKIKVAPARFHPFFVQTISEHIGLNLLDYVGLEVAAIDGVPAVEYILEFADTEVGLVKDLNARFNKALLTVSVGSDGNFTQDFGTFTFQPSVPLMDTVTFSFKIPGETHLTNVTIPYFGYYIQWRKQAFSSAAEYWALNCKPSPPPPSEAVTNADTSPVFSLQRELISAFFVNETATGVIVIPTVSADDDKSDQKFEAEFASAFVRGVSKVHAFGARHLILDLTQNGGGDIGLGYAVVSALFPGTIPNLPTVIRAETLAALMAETAIAKDANQSLFHWSTWADAASDLPFSSAEGFFFPLVTRTYAGVKGKYSQPLKDIPAQTVVPPLPLEQLQPFGPEPIFAAEDILILTNGFCGSTCSLITSSLTERFGVRTVTVGGIPGTPQQVSNFPGGQVVELETLLGEIEYLGLSGHPLAPSALPRQASVTFTFRAVFSVKSDAIPLEFVFTNSTFNLDYTNVTATSPVALWREVSALF